MQKLLDTLIDNVAFMMTALPLVGAVLVLTSARLGVEAIRRTVLTNVLLSVLLAGAMVGAYDPPTPRDDQGDARESKSVGTTQMKTFIPWTSRDYRGDLRVWLMLGVDGLSLWMIALVPLVVLPAAVFGPKRDAARPAAFYALLLVLESATIGLFAALDVITFTVCLELALVTTYCLIAGWGGFERRDAAAKFLLYNLAGSLLIFAGLLAVVIAYPTMAAAAERGSARTTLTIFRLTHDIPHWARMSEAGSHWNSIGLWVMPALIVGFAIRMPVFPFHTWLPSTNLEAPSTIAAVSTALGVKVGLYGMFRFVLPLFPRIAISWPDAPEYLVTLGPTLAGIAVFGVVCTGLMALGQSDLTKFASYVSASQMGLCLAGLFSLTVVGLSGSWLLAVAHAAAITIVLLLAGHLDRAYGTREITAISGLASRMPRLTACFVIGALSLSGAPLLAGFAGESLVLFGMILTDTTTTIWALLGVLLVVWASVWLIQRLFFGRLREPVPDDRFFDQATIAPESEVRTDEEQESLPTPFSLTSGRQRDLNPLEFAALLPLVGCLFWIGLQPQFYLDRTRPTIDAIPKLSTPVRFESSSVRASPSARAVSRRGPSNDWSNDRAFSSARDDE